MDQMIVIEVNRTKATIRKVMQKVRRNECLNCSSVMHKRGLCIKCASSFEYRLKKMSGKSAKKRYEASLIESGLLLNPQEIRDLKVVNDPFVSAAIDIEKRN